MGYSGEVYLYGWAKSALSLPARTILSIIKDNAIVSSAASTAFALSLLAVFVAAGDLSALGVTQGDGARYLGLAFALVAVILIAGIAFKGRLFTLSSRVLMGAFGLYFFRLVIMNVLQLVQWTLVIPGVPWQTWIVFLAAQVVISRIPLLPGNDLVFLTTSMELASVLGIPVDALLAMFVVTSASDRALNLVMFGLVSWLASDSRPLVRIGRRRCKCDRVMRKGTAIASLCSIPSLGTNHDMTPHFPAFRFRLRPAIWTNGHQTLRPPGLDPPRSGHSPCSVGGRRNGVRAAADHHRRLRVGPSGRHSRPTGTASKGGGPCR